MDVLPLTRELEGLAEFDRAAEALVVIVREAEPDAGQRGHRGRQQAAPITGAVGRIAPVAPCAEHRHEQDDGAEEQGRAGGHGQSVGRARRGERPDLAPRLVQRAPERDEREHGQGKAAGDRHLPDIRAVEHDRDAGSQAERHGAGRDGAAGGLREVALAGRTQQPHSGEEPDRDENRDRLCVLEVVAGHRRVRPEQQQHRRDTKIEVELALVIAEVVQPAGVDETAAAKIGVGLGVVRVCQRRQSGRGFQFQAELARAKTVHQPVVIRRLRGAVAQFRNARPGDDGVQRHDRRAQPGEEDELPVSGRIWGGFLHRR